MHEAKAAGASQHELNRALGDLLHWEDQFKHVTGETWLKPLPVDSSCALLAHGIIGCWDEWTAYTLTTGSAA